MRFPPCSLLLRSLLLILAACVFPAGCGQKGPLYLRDTPPPGVKPPKPKPYEPVPYPPELTEEAK